MTEELKLVVPGDTSLYIMRRTCPCAEGRFVSKMTRRWGMQFADKSPSDMVANDILGLRKLLAEEPEKLREISDDSLLELIEKETLEKITQEILETVDTFIDALAQAPLNAFVTGAIGEAGTLLTSAVELSAISKELGVDPPKSVAEYTQMYVEAIAESCTSDEARLRFIGWVTDQAQFMGDLEDRLSLLKNVQDIGSKIGGLLSGNPMTIAEVAKSQAEKCANCPPHKRDKCKAPFVPSEGVEVVDVSEQQPLEQPKDAVRPQSDTAFPAGPMFHPALMRKRDDDQVH